MHSIHRAPLKIAAKPPPQPSAPKAVKLKNPWAHRAHPSYEPSSLNLLNPGPSVAHPAAPFRLAALATHPREGGGQVTWRRRTLPQTAISHFVGGKGYHDLQTCLPPLVGGRGTTKWWKGAAEGGIIKTAAKPLPPSSEPGPRSGPSSRPLPSRCARHPPPGKGVGR